MFQEGDMIIYGNTGVCRVELGGHPDHIKGADDNRLYYTLAPVYQAGVIYAPVDTPVFTRPILTRQAAEELIAKIPAIRAEIYNGCDQRVLSDCYRACFDTHRCETLVQLIKTVHSKNEICQKNGKKPAQLDQRYMKRAEDLLYGEFAVVLGIAREDVEQYITERIAQAS